MLVTDLADFLNGELTANELQNKIGAETDAWAKKLSERGGSAPIALLGTISTLELTRTRALRLLDALIKTEVSIATFAYIVDAMLLSENFRWSNDTVRDALENLVIPEPAKNLDMRQAWKSRERLAAIKTN